MNTQLTFAHALCSYRKVYDLEPLFGDFLDLCLCVLSPTALAGFPLDRERFESILLKYSDPALPLDFTMLFALLLRAVRCRQSLPHQLHCYCDVLGDFYEEHILGYDPEIPFDGWELDQARLRPELITIPGSAPLVKRTLFDPLCASGRRLLNRRWMHTIGCFYGADTRPECAKMSILNLFLHHAPEAEVICTKTTGSGKSFLTGYAFSPSVPGIREIERAEESRVWQLIGDGAALSLAA